MRILLALAALITTAAPAGAATRNFGVNGFDRIRVDGPFRVKLTTGVAPFARASGGQGAIDSLALAVNGDTLSIRLNRSAWGGYPGASSGPVEIEIGTHELEAVWINGSGSLAINQVKGLSFDLSLQGSGSARIESAMVDQLKVTLFGMSTATIGGVVPQLTAVVRGAGGLDATQLAVKDATIGADGAVTIGANVSGSAKVQAQGSATVTFTGDPSCTVRAAGSATVSGCR